MPRRLLSIPDLIHKFGDGFGIYDDFTWFVTAHQWTTVASDSGAIAVGDAVGGRLTIEPSDGTAGDNDETYLVSTNEIFKVLAGKPIEIEACIQFTEVATNAANIVFGLADAAGANLLLDNGAGPATTFDGALFYKVDGSTLWSVASSNATAQVKNETEHTAGGSSFQTLRIRITPRDSAEAEVEFWIDPAGGSDLVQCRSKGSNPRTPAIKHTVAISGMEEMHLVLGSKNGTAAQQPLVVDYAWGWQKR